ncbi:MAG: hypothetical protein HYZ29_34120 [Myxococcales bacterium]|nr:hypothetical protein [Myxococcales bacterium]
MVLRIASLFAFLVLTQCGEDAAGGTAGPDGGGIAGGSGSGGGSATGGASTGGGGSASGGTASGGGGAPSSCAGVSCSGQGTCIDGDAGATCKCNPGFHAVGVECKADETCAGVSCGNCGQCKVVGGVAACECPKDYQVVNGKCQLATDPCASANCASDEACVPEAHCQALGACVKKCDCSNCGNCGPDNSDGKWDDMQEYCGNPKAQPATKSCAKPCPAGQGCLPFATPICWPMEGCLSL